MATHLIAIVNNANLNDPTHVVKASNRTSRAIRKARVLKQQNPNVVLFRICPKNGTRPISLKKQQTRIMRDFNCNAPFISNESIPMPERAGRRRQA